MSFETLRDEPFETLRYEKQDGVVVLTLHRPERHNAINGAMSRELPLAWDAIKRDPEVVVVIVTGAGERAFCTGFDVDDVAAGTASVGEERDRGSLAGVRFTAVQNRCWKPVITAVGGMCAAGGLHFVADSDINLCSEDATFFDPHVKVGLVAGLEPVGLARRIPLEEVLRMALVGGRERMDAARALRVGLVSEVVPRAELLPRARALAGLLARNSPAAMAASKRAIWASLERGLHDGLSHAWSILRQHGASPDFREGPRAFAERRAPDWAPLSWQDAGGDPDVVE